LAWRAAGAGYHALLRLCARAAVALDAGPPCPGARYRDKAEGELEPMLALWPDVLVLPVTAPLAPLDMVALRAYPVHPLGLADGLPWTDGAPAPPSEFFFHDLDHARFKVREDLRALGIQISDAYQGGTTVDPATGRHRLILSEARGRIGDRLWARAGARAALARRLLDGVATLPGGPPRAAAELLLFEIIHEKSFPLDAAVLDRELGGDAHIDKLRLKVARRFFPDAIDDVVVAALVPARAALRAMLSGAPS